jgi:uncharacterized protein YegL
MSAIDQIEIQIENAEPVVKTTYVALVVDESGSMDSMKKQAISLFNENLNTMKVEGKKNNIRNVISLIKFSSKAEVIHKNVELDVINEVDNNSYSPGGYTAMYDGIGTAISVLKSAPDYNNKDTAFLVLVITDGEENHSREFQGHQISEMIKDLEQNDKRWTFTVLGANLDLNKLADTLGIKGGNVQSFNFSDDGFEQASGVMSRGIVNYSSVRASGQMSVENFYDTDNDSVLDSLQTHITDNTNTRIDTDNQSVLNSLQNPIVSGSNTEPYRKRFKY